jgi:hypothetical protein
VTLTNQGGNVTINMQQLARRLVLPNDTSEMTDRQLQTKRDLETLRRQKVQDRIRALMLDERWLTEEVGDNLPAIIPFIREMSRPDGDPTAFRTELCRRASILAEQQVQVSEDDL